MARFKSTVLCNGYRNQWVATHQEVAACLFSPVLFSWPFWEHLFHNNLRKQYKTIWKCVGLGLSEERLLLFCSFLFYSKGLFASIFFFAFFYEKNIKLCENRLWPSEMLLLVCSLLFPATLACSSSQDVCIYAVKSHHQCNQAGSPMWPWMI